MYRTTPTVWPVTTWRLLFALILTAGLVLVPGAVPQAQSAPALAPCDSPANPIVAENCLPGTPASEWDVTGVGDDTIQGFATDISVNRGETVYFKVKTDARDYRIDIHRLGYYGGLGARKVATVQPSAGLPQSQPACLYDAATGLTDCGNWAVSASWAVPAEATSGIYVASLVRADTNGQSHIVFIVRNDASTSDLLFQTSDTTWHAYNGYGGSSLYWGLPAGRAYKVSYNRPFSTRGTNPEDFVFNAEYPMVRWLEANGYNVSYFTDVDSDRRGSQIQSHKVFLSVGHDEYWSAGQRANVEAARNAGVNLAFFSGNEIFWKTRWENSIADSSTPYRTLVCYKETHAGAVIDPQDPPTWTGTWRDPRFTPPADGGRPENALSGTIFTVNGVQDDSIMVPAAYSKLRFWRNTSVTTLQQGQTATMPAGTLGYEWDEDLDNGARPAGLIRMSSATVNVPGYIQDYGSTYASGTATHHLTLYRHSSGALVFGAGTVQWAWGLDATHDRGPGSADPRMQQATVNLLADMGTQPATLQAGLVSATASTDTTPPASTITSPSTGSTVPTGNPITITGTAVDTGGVVGGVEVSTDGGITWHPATGQDNWTYTWTPTSSGSVTIKSRAVDDSGNLEIPGPGVTVTVPGSTCPCSIWNGAATPAVASENDSNSAELGVRFRSDVNGQITGIRFYKGSANTGPHVGSLWTGDGQLLAQATFTSETASGWQQVSLASPVPITANTVYVASYHTNIGRYAVDEDYFQASGVDAPPLHALRDGESGGNGVYLYTANSAFPNQTYRSENYWVDVVFATSATPSDTTPPTVTTATPVNSATNVSVGSSVTAAFSEPLDPATVNAETFQLLGPNSVAIAVSVTYDSATRTSTLQPNAALAGSTVYTAVVKGGTTDPRVKDLVGNPLAADYSWSFTTAAPSDTIPPTVTATSPAAGATGVSATASVTAAFNEALDPTTINATTFELRNATSAPVAATVSYDSATRTATLKPTASLPPSTTYTATITTGVKDLVGNPLAANYTWSFATAATPTTYSIWNGTATSVSTDPDRKATELGVKFRSDVDGQITGIRFYKTSANTGTHVGSLWTSTGQLLARATFTGETTSGWQQVRFASPVPITANTVYVASYHTNVGRYAVTPNYFRTTGFDNPPLHALRNGESGGNGVYRYSSSSAFPTSTYKSGNYWVDVVLVTSTTP